MNTGRWTARKRGEITAELKEWWLNESRERERVLEPSQGPSGQAINRTTVRSGRKKMYIIITAPDIFKNSSHNCLFWSYAGLSSVFLFLLGLLVLILDSCGRLLLSLVLVLSLDWILKWNSVLLASFSYLQFLFELHRPSAVVAAAAKTTATTKYQHSSLWLATETINSITSSSPIEWLVIR